MHDKFFLHGRWHLCDVYVQELQQRLASLEERISPGQLESDNDRLLLIQEKEQLLRELR